jgi:hypothetical protein
MFSKQTLRKMSIGRNGILATMFVLSMFALPVSTFASAAATPCTCSVSLSPTKNVVGGTVNVAGTGFAPNTMITVSIGGKNIQTATSNSMGAFSTSFVIPMIPGGTYPIAATDGVKKAHAPFKVLPFTTIIRTTIKSGYVPELTGTGFAANSVVTVTISNSTGVYTLGTTTSLSQGQFTFPPTPATPGHYSLRATDATGITRAIPVIVKA